MVNINGKEWNSLDASDILTVIEQQDFDESFYYEFKDDRVTTKKLVEEISAFANTFGGYIFIGITDDKQIEGCTAWNEQRIHTTIHDAITPTPAFDIKKFVCNTAIVFVIKIEEGAEPPYITSSGKIYERLSSGSFTIKDSIRLSQIYNKREQLLAKMEQKISILPIPTDIGNIYGYIDMGFILALSDKQTAIDTFNQADLKSIAKKMIGKMEHFNLTYVGESIVFTPGGLSTDNGQLPAHTNNFLEIMADGSARMRILLLNNNKDNSSVNMMYALVLLKAYQELYTYIMGDLFPSKIAYAKKYEALTVRRQFYPTLFFDQAVLEIDPDRQAENKKMREATRKHREVLGVDIVVTDDRIPKTGLYTIDKHSMERWGAEYTADEIINELFYSRFSGLGVRATRDEEEG